MTRSLLSVAERTRVEPALRAVFPDGLLHDYASVGSTMDLAREAAEAQAPEGTLVWAGEQRQGRGRRGRGWASPVGGIWASLLLRPTVPYELSGQLAVLVAVGAARGLRARFGVPIGVKWPNDLTLHGRKLGGTLIELTADQARPDWLIVGMGINANNDPPAEARQAATSLRADLGARIELSEGLVALIQGIGSVYGLYQREGFGPVRDLWEELSVLGPHVWIETPPNNGSRRRVRVSGLAEDGRLCVEEAAGHVRRLDGDEISLTLED